MQHSITHSTGRVDVRNSEDDALAWARDFYGDKLGFHVDYFRDDDGMLVIAAGFEHLAIIEPA